MSASPPCPVCGADGAERWSSARDAEYRTTPESFEFLRCARCGVLFLHPMPTDRLTEIYPPTYYSFAPKRRSLVRAVKDRLDARAFAQRLRSIPGDSLAVLDVGGGSGWLLDVVRSVDPRVNVTQVVDFDPAAAEEARRNGHEAFVGTIEQFTTERRFDLILLLNLIEHVADPLAVLRKVGSLLSERGIALVQTPNYDSLDARLFRHADWGGYHCPRHWVLFDRPGFERAATEAGLTVRRFEYTQGASFWAFSLLAWLERRGLARITRERPAFRHPLFSPLAAGFAAFDLARLRLLPGVKTSQMTFVLGRAPSVSEAVPKEAAA